ncbi:MAG: TlpA family protein disulfide reductase [Candidatus Omnitrophica bacterium]|nr:TlpA family protein disulfide reductase [Candidatus Omnitrophota bacterium]
MAKLVATVALFLTVLTAAAQAAVSEGEEWYGTAAPPWDVVEWSNSQPLTLEQLRGKVVLVRWWTGPECPYCAASAPSLNALHERYHAKGLVVVGFYHHKSAAPVTRRHVERLVKRYRFRFPVAIDPEWRTLKRWWLDGHERAWTSVSFLLDRAGVIRYVHPGGSYTGDDVAALTSRIEELLTR